MKRWIALALLTLPAAAQGGYTTEKFPELGLEFPRARNFEQTPLQPGEEYRILSYRELERVTEREQRRAIPSFWVLRIDGDPEPAEAKTRSDKAGDDEGSVHSFQRYVRRHLDDWTVSAPEEGRERDGYQGASLDLIPEKGSLRGYAYAYTREEPTPRTYVLLGWYGEDDRKELTKIYRYMAERMRFDEPEDQDLEKLRRHYDRKTYRDAAYRIGVRTSLLKGWDAEDTRNYIVVFDTRDQPLIRRVKREIEAIRKAYLEEFPPAGEMTAVSTVRVCESPEEYSFYGGPPGSAGYWNSRTEELVLYDAGVKDGARTIDTDTFIVLYHEAFHQYIHYSAGELAPHSWFNEGYGDYFSGAVISGGKVAKIDVNPWRLEPIQHYIENGRAVSWKKIIGYSQAEFYKNAGVCYSQAWSMVYFLRKSRQVAKHPTWSKILPTYFDTLKSEWQAELAALEEDGKAGDPQELEQARSRTRERAVEAAFEDVDLVEIELAWEDFTLDLEP